MVALVYFASIADNLKVLFGCMIGASLVSMVVFAMMRDAGNQYIKYRHFMISLTVSIVFGVLCAITPSTEEVYKIAGVAGQEKAIISVTGQPTSVNHVEVVKP